MSYHGLAHESKAFILTAFELRDTDKQKTEFITIS